MKPPLGNVYRSFCVTLSLFQYLLMPRAAHDEFCLVPLRLRNSRNSPAVQKNVSCVADNTCVQLELDGWPLLQLREKK